MEAAIQRGDLLSVKRLVLEDVNVLKARFGRYKDAPLHLAAQNGHRCIVEWLTDRCNADVNMENEKGETALMLACRCWTANHKDVVQYLIAKGSHLDKQTASGMTALLFACDRGHLVPTQLLVRSGATVDLQDHGGSDALLQACTHNHTEIAQFLIESGADPNIQNARGYSPLMVCAFLGHNRITRLLLHNGADLHLQGENGETALMMASGFWGFGSNYESAKFLLEETVVNVNFQNKKGQTALMCAATSGDLHIVTLLVENGADVNLQDDEGQTALMLAIWWAASVDMVSCLLRNGARIDLQDNLGRTALAMACEKQHVGMAKLLQNGNSTPLLCL